MSQHVYLSCDQREGSGPWIPHVAEACIPDGSESFSWHTLKAQTEPHKDGKNPNENFHLYQGKSASSVWWKSDVAFFFLSIQLEFPLTSMTEKIWPDNDYGEDLHCWSCQEDYTPSVLFRACSRHFLCERQARNNIRVQYSHHQWF